MSISAGLISMVAPPQVSFRLAGAISITLDPHVILMLDVAV
jgi:hypothetical protein